MFDPHMAWIGSDGPLVQPIPRKGTTEISLKIGRQFIPAGVAWPILV
jgi:hypothetical protein